MTRLYPTNVKLGLGNIEKKKKLIAPLFTYKFKLFFTKYLLLDVVWHRHLNDYQNKLLDKIRETPFTLYHYVTPNFFSSYDNIKEISVDISNCLIVKTDASVIDTLIYYCVKNNIDITKLNMEFKQIYYTNWDILHQEIKEQISKMRKQYNIKLIHDYYLSDDILNYDVKGKNYTFYYNHINQKNTRDSDQMNNLLVRRNLLIARDLQLLKKGANAIISFNYNQLTAVEGLLGLLTNSFEKVKLYKGAIRKQAFFFHSMAICEGYNGYIFDNELNIDQLKDIIIKKEDNGHLKNLDKINKIIEKDTNRYDKANIKNQKIIELESYSDMGKYENKLFEVNMNRQIINALKWLEKRQFKLSLNANILRENYCKEFNKIYNLYLSWSGLIQVEIINNTMEYSVKMDTLDDKFIKEINTRTTYLNYINSIIESRDVNRWNKYAYLVDRGKELKELLIKKYNFKKQNIMPTNAYLKMIEILNLFKLEIIRLDKIDALLVCEAPGNFIRAFETWISKSNIKDIKSKKLNWYANSLNPYYEKEKDSYDKELADSYGIIKNNMDRWLFGKNKTGDLMNVNVIKYIWKKCNKKMMFGTSDCGISISNCEYNKTEDLNAKINYGAFLALIGSLSIDGNLVMKEFLPMTTPVNISRVYLMSKLFNTVLFIKPVTSRPLNREFYIICKGFRGINNDNLDKLLSFMNNFDLNKTIVEMPKDDLWYNEYLNAIDKLINRHTGHVEGLLMAYDDKELLHKITTNIQRQQDTFNKLWINSFFNSLNFK